MTFPPALSIAIRIFAVHLAFLLSLLMYCCFETPQILYDSLRSSYCSAGFIQYLKVKGHGVITFEGHQASMFIQSLSFLAGTLLHSFQSTFPALSFSPFPNLNSLSSFRLSRKSSLGVRIPLFSNLHLSLPIFSAFCPSFLRDIC